MAFKTDTTLDQSQKARVMLFLRPDRLFVGCGRFGKVDSGFSFVSPFCVLVSSIQVLLER